MYQAQGIAAVDMFVVASASFRLFYVMIILAHERRNIVRTGVTVVGRSKTKAGTGRVVPLTRRACAALTSWLARFPSAAPDSHVFPFHHVSFAKIGQ